MWSSYFIVIFYQGQLQFMHLPRSWRGLPQPIRRRWRRLAVVAAFRLQLGQLLLFQPSPSGGRRRFIKGGAKFLHPVLDQGWSALLCHLLLLLLLWLMTSACCITLVELVDNAKNVVQGCVQVGHIVICLHNINSCIKKQELELKTKRNCQTMKQNEV